MRVINAITVGRYRFSSLSMTIFYEVLEEWMIYVVNCNVLNANLKIIYTCRINWYGTICENLKNTLAANSMLRSW